MLAILNVKKGLDPSKWVTAKLGRLVAFLCLGPSISPYTSRAYSWLH